MNTAQAAVTDRATSTVREQSKTPKARSSRSWPKGMRFMHFIRSNGHRMTIAYRVTGNTETSTTYEVGISRYNPNHEPEQYTKRTARALAAGAILTREAAEAVAEMAGVSPRRSVFTITVDHTSGTPVASLVNGLVAQGGLPSSWRVNDERDARRFTNYIWVEDKGLVRARPQAQLR